MTAATDANLAPADRAARPPPRVSVIVPVRNDPARIGRCVAAARGGTFADVEVLVVDDGSTDDTAAVAAAAGAFVLRLDRNAGPAAARNHAARAARGEILFFVDADVLLRPDAIARAVDTFDRRPDVDALFGSYDLTPEHPAFLSQYKNLSHRFVHQQANERATTFWTGCGAVRRHVYLAVGGLDAAAYGRPSIEDIELGARLHRAGHRIVVDKRVQATHLKRWTFAGLVRSDVFDRGIPWTRLILRERDLPNDLNLGRAQRVAAVMAVLVVLAWLAASWANAWLLLLPVVVFGALICADAVTARVRVPSPLRWLAVAGAAGGVVGSVVALGGWAAAALLAAPLAAVVVINWRYYAFFAAARGVPFAAGVLPMHVLYYLYSGFCLAAGTVLHALDARRRRRRRADGARPAAAAGV